MYRLEEIKRAARGMWSLVVGLNITGKYFLQPNVTIHYPRQEVDNLATFRGHIELIPEDNDPLTPRCISCGTCAKACPSGCITVIKKKAPAPTPEEVEKGVKPKAPKDPETFKLDFTLCSLCGQCVMSCPADAIRFSQNINIAGYSRQDFHFDLIARLRSRLPKHVNKAE
ncbi:NADH-quinone oxidoreductase subunit I [anaerobic digester metagenome]